MNTELTITTVLWGIIVLLIAVVTGAGIVPLLKSGTAYFEKKRELAEKTLVDLDTALAHVNNLPKTLIHETVKELQVDSSTPIIVTTTDLLARGFELMRQILPVTDEAISAGEVASAANMVINFIERMTDSIPGNALTATVTTAVPSVMIDGADITSRFKDSSG